MSLLSRIKILREEHGNMSINKLEKESGLSRGSIAKWDDHSPSPDKLKKVADYFGVSIDYLLGNTDIKKETPANQDITFDDFTYALHNETKELSEEKKQQLLEMARFFKQQQDKKKEK